MTKEHKAEVTKIVRRLRRFGMVVERRKSTKEIYDALFLVRPLSSWARRTVQYARSFDVRKLCRFTRIAAQQAHRFSDLLESTDYKLGKFDDDTNFTYVKFVNDESDRLVAFKYNAH